MQCATFNLYMDLLLWITVSKDCFNMKDSPDSPSSSIENCCFFASYALITQTRCLVAVVIFLLPSSLLLYCKFCKLSVPTASNLCCILVVFIYHLYCYVIILDICPYYVVSPLQALSASSYVTFFYSVRPNSYTEFVY